MWERHQREGVVIATSLALVAAVALVVSAYGHGMAGAAQAELFEWNTKTDPIFAGSEGDTVTGVDADDPNFNIKDLEYDSPFERMTSAEETRCPMCSGQREYHNNLYNLEHGGDATDIDSPEYRPDDEREGAAYEGGRGRVPATAAAGPLSEVSGPQGALQRMLVTVMAKMERNAEDYRLTDADQRREAAAARLLNKKRLLLKTEEAEIQEDMSGVQILLLQRTHLCLCRFFCFCFLSLSASVLSISGSRGPVSLFGPLSLLSLSPARSLSLWCLSGPSPEYVSRLGPSLSLSLSVSCKLLATQFPCPFVRECIHILLVLHFACVQTQSF
jgi:hypothetical protein